MVLTIIHLNQFAIYFYGNALTMNEDLKVHIRDWCLVHSYVGNEDVHDQVCGRAGSNSLCLVCKGILVNFIRPGKKIK